LVLRGAGRFALCFSRGVTTGAPSAAAVLSLDDS